MTELPDGWSVRDGRDPEVELRRLKDRFQKISNRFHRKASLRRFYRFAALTLLTAAGSFALVGGLMVLKPWTAIGGSSWTTTMRAKHVAAYPNCAATRALGLAPAYRGQPGYWPQHDRDGDGVACEPWPR